MQILEWQIDASALRILAHVANDVGELEREPKFLRIDTRGRIGVAENLDANEADG